MSERPALLRLVSWCVAPWPRVVIVGETAKRYRIRADKPTRLAGRNRWLKPGETALVPKHAVQLLYVAPTSAESDAAEGEKG